MAHAKENPSAGGLSRHLKKWWKGDETPKPRAANGQKARSASVAERQADVPKPSGKAVWTPQRIASLQVIFGDGIDSPAGRERVLDLIEPAQMNSEMRVLNIGAGMGTTARIIAKETGARVDGLESEALLLEEAQRLTSLDGLDGSVDIRNVGLDHQEILERKYDAIVARDALFRTEDRRYLFRDLSNLLKPESHLLLSEMMLVPSKGRDERAKWNAMHKDVPQLLEFDEVRDGLHKCGFDLRVTKKETKSYMTKLAKDLQEFAKSIEANPLPLELRDWVMWEAGYWTALFKAMQSGGLIMYRIHAMTLPADPLKA